MLYKSGFSERKLTIVRFQFKVLSAIMYPQSLVYVLSIIG